MEKEPSPHQKRLQIAYEKVFKDDIDYPLNIVYNGIDSETVEYLKKACSDIRPLLKYCLERRPTSFNPDNETYSEIIQILEGLEIHMKKCNLISLVQFGVLVLGLNKLLIASTTLKGTWFHFETF